MPPGDMSSQAKRTRPSINRATTKHTHMHWKANTTEELLEQKAQEFKRSKLNIEVRDVIKS